MGRPGAAVGDRPLGASGCPPGLTLAGLADLEIAAGGLPSTEPLVAAVADSGLPADVVEPNAFIVVDAVHGAALGVGSPGRHDGDDLALLRAAFEVGLDTTRRWGARWPQWADPGGHDQ